MLCRRPSVWNTCVEGSNHNNRKERIVETAKQTRDRAAAILREFCISDEVLRVLDSNERPRNRMREHAHSDGRYYGNNQSYYRATYCVHASRRFERVTSVEVRQDFDAKKLREVLKHVMHMGDTLAQLAAREAENPTQYGYSKVVRTRKPHECSLKSCAAEIPAKSEVIVHSSGEPNEPSRYDYRRYFHPNCYEQARLEDRHLPPVGEV